MLIKFNGTTGEKQGGCPVCGRKRTGSGYLESKYYVLPSGNHRVFRKGVATEVDDRDGEYLLSHNWTYTDISGKEVKVFEWVK